LQHYVNVILPFQMNSSTAYNHQADCQSDSTDGNDGYH